MTLVVLDEGFWVTGNSIPKVCQALVNRGLAIPDKEYRVCNARTGKVVATIRYEPNIDSWMSWSAISGTHGLRPNKPEVKE